MVEHREQEAKYNALNPRQMAVKLKVLPYPDSPNRVYPGQIPGITCYHMLINGAFRFVFVIDLRDPFKSGLYNPQ